MRSRIAFVVGIGGYRDAEAAIRFVTTGAFRPLGDPREFRVAPNRYGRWAFLLANAGRLDMPGRRALAARDRATTLPRSATPTRRARPPALGPEGRAVLALVENRDPDAVTG